MIFVIKNNNFKTENNVFEIEKIKQNIKTANQNENYF